MYQTINGVKTLEQIRQELIGANYPGPWDEASMLRAYSNASQGPVTPVTTTTPEPNRLMPDPAPPPTTTTDPIGSPTLDRERLAELMRQFNEQLALQKQQLDAQIAQFAQTFGLDVRRLEEAARQFQAQLAAQQQQFGATLGLDTRRLEEQARQFAAQLAQQQAQFGATLGLDTRRFEEAARQFAAELAQRQTEFGATLGLDTRRLEEQARQFQAQLAAQKEQFAAQIGLEKERLAFERQQALEELRLAQSADQRANALLKIQQADQDLRNLQFKESQYQFRQEFGEQQRQFNLGLQSQVGQALLGAATQLRGPRDYFQFQQFTSGGRNLFEQLRSSTPRPAFSAPTGQIQPANIQDLLSQLGLSGGVFGRAAAAQNAAAPKPELILPHQVSPAVWDQLGPVGQQLALSSAEAMGFDPSEWVRQLNATRPTGQSLTGGASATRFASPVGVF